MLDHVCIGMKINNYVTLHSIHTHTSHLIPLIHQDMTIQMMPLRFVEMNVATDGYTVLGMYYYAYMLTVSGTL